MSPQSKKKAVTKGVRSQGAVKKSAGKKSAKKSGTKKSPTEKSGLKKSGLKKSDLKESGLKKSDLKKSSTKKNSVQKSNAKKDTKQKDSVQKKPAKKSPPNTPQKIPTQSPATESKQKSAQNAPRLWLVDGSGYIFRAFYAIPTRMTRDKMPVNAVFGFTNMLLRLQQSIAEQDCITVVFDAGSHSFRNDIYPEYKANRDETPPDLVPQFAATREAATALGFPVVERADVEADDIIATYARNAESQKMEAVIVSSDKDLMQLVRPGVSMWDPMKEKNLGEDEVLEKFGRYRHGSLLMCKP